jgi:hypothetical protein
VEPVDAQSQPLVQFRLVREGVDGSMPLYTLGPNARLIYANADVLQKLRRFAVHPLSFPLVRVHRGIPFSLRSIRAETNIIGQEQHQVTLTFDGLKTSQASESYYYRLGGLPPQNLSRR